MRLVLLAKDNMTGMAGIWIPSDKDEGSGLTLSIVNPKFVGSEDRLSYFLTLDPAIPDDLLMSETPTELQGKPLELGSYDAFMQSVKANLEGAVPYRSTQSWKELHSRVLNYANDKVVDKNIAKYLNVIQDEVLRLQESESNASVSE